MKWLLVITGHGRHSQGGAVLRPGITRWLQQKQYTYVSVSLSGRVVAPVQC